MLCIGLLSSHRLQISVASAQGRRHSVLWGYIILEGQDSDLGIIWEGLLEEGTSKFRLKVSRLSQTAAVWACEKEIKSCVSWQRAVEFEVMSLWPCATPPAGSETWGCSSVLPYQSWLFLGQEVLCFITDTFPPHPPLPVQRLEFLAIEKHYFGRVGAPY